MTKVKSISVLMMIALGMISGPVLAADPTVGRFYTAVARAKNLGSVDAATAETSLRGAGFSLPKLDLGKTLTEGDLTSISSALGVKVTTHRPEQLVSETQLSTYLSAFDGQLRGTPVGTAAPTSTANIPGIYWWESANNKGLHKGHHKSTSNP